TSPGRQTGGSLRSRARSTEGRGAVGSHRQTDRHRRRHSPRSPEPGIPSGRLTALAWRSAVIPAACSSSIAMGRISGGSTTTDPTGKGVVHPLPGFYGWYQPIWSPDGTKIVVTDDRPGLGNVDGPAVRVILDVAGKAPPIVIAAPGTTPDQVPDWAASWQRLAL